MEATPDIAFDRWCAALERRHLADLTFAEVRRALQALSATYVERRDRLARCGALDGAGKRAAFALFYGPLHYAITRHVVTTSGLHVPPPREIVDLGCGTGAAGAAWAIAAGATPRLLGVDINAWAAAEASWSWRELGLAGRAVRGDLAATRLPGTGAAIVAGWCANELPAPARENLLARLLDAAARGARVLIVEPIALRMLGWWEGWAAAFDRAGGRADTWRFAAGRPPIVARLDDAAGLDHRELTARSLVAGGREIGDPAGPVRRGTAGGAAEITG